MQAREMEIEKKHQPAGKATGENVYRDGALVDASSTTMQTTPQTNMPQPLPEWRKKIGLTNTVPVYSFEGRS